MTESVIRVTTGDDVVDATDGLTSLREAIALATAQAESTGTSDTIIFDGVTSVEWTRAFSITNTITIDGQYSGSGDPSVVIADTGFFSRPFDRIFDVDLSIGENFTLSGLRIEDGFVDVEANPGEGGSAMRIDGNGGVYITDSQFVGNTFFAGFGEYQESYGGFGGAIFHNGGTLTITDSSFSENGNGQRGGAIASSTSAGQLSISGSTFTDNVAREEGGAIYAANFLSTVSITNSTFDSNTVDGSIAGTSTAGGAIFGIEADLTIIGSQFLDDRAFEGALGSGDGGAIALLYSSASIQNTDFQRSKSDNFGGAIYGLSTDLTISGSSFLNTEWFGGGNAIEMLGDGTLDVTTTAIDLTGTTNPVAIFGPDGRNYIEADPEGTEYRMGEADDDILLLGTGMTLRLGGGADLVIGTTATFYATTVSDLSIEDVFWMTDDKAPSEEFGITMVITPVGEDDTITEFYLEGATSTFYPIRFLAGNDISGTDVLLSHVADETQFGLIDILPDLIEGQTVADADPERAAMIEFFSEGWEAYSITIRRDLDHTSNNNAIGVYEVSGNGTITNVQILFEDAKDGGTEIFQRVPGSDRYVEFFIIKDGADFAKSLSGEALAIDTDGSLLVNGIESDQFIWHMDSSRNSDNANHALIGSGGQADTIRIGFEDASFGDNDFQDVVIDVQGLDVLLLT
ncbi:MAG: hypothetical protein VX874_04055 [Pseudomonadota bacterium]|nr:hypothetical protein [Pseudomonadota bacterium]